MLTNFALCHGQMNTNSNSTHKMMQNTFMPKCNERWVQMCIHQLQSNPTTHVGATLGPSLGGCKKMVPDFQKILQNFLKLGHRWLGYELFFTKLYLKLPLHLHHHVGKLR
jgi:hypothetical protein